MAADQIAKEMDKVYLACDNYQINQDPASYQHFLEVTSEADQQISGIAVEDLAVSQSLSDKLDTAPFEKVDILAVNTLIDTRKIHAINTILKLKYILNASSLDSATRQQLIMLNKNYDASLNKGMVYAVNYNLLPVSKDYSGLQDFKTKILPTLTSLPFSSYAWSTDATELERLVMTNIAQGQEVVNEMTALVGNQNFALLELKAEVIAQLISSGLTQTEAEIAAEEVIRDRVIQKSDGTIEFIEDSKNQ